MHIAIVVLNWNGKQDTLECLQSLKNLHYSPYSVIVADNGSSDGSLDAIASLYPEVQLLNNQKNLGFAEGNNRAITFALQNALLILNNDTVVEPNLLTALASASQENPHAIFGCVPYLFSQKNVLDHLGGVWNPLTAQFDLISYRQQVFSPPPSLDYVCGCSLFAPSDAFKKIGLFDPRFFLFWEESDFCHRAKQNGYTLKICPEAKLWHKVSASFSGGKPHTSYFWWRNRLLWIEKNIPRKQRLSLYMTTLLPEIAKLHKHYLLKCLHLLPYFLFKSSAFPLKKTQLRIYAASLLGVYHYLLRRFYNGPSWLFQKKN
ncbi:MAG: glycosyltransferase family 2 protein [Chlamydiae bacterium]|nr:glycosyltransferase family 2 protein [Chlamydiota bacterium]